MDARGIKWDDLWIIVQPAEQPVDPSGICNLLVGGRMFYSNTAKADKYLPLFTTAEAARVYLEGLRAKGMQNFARGHVPGPLDFVKLLELAQKEGVGLVVFDLVPGADTVTPYYLQEVMDDVRKTFLGDSQQPGRQNRPDNG
jgi:hypothetical protein